MPQDNYFPQANSLLRPVERFWIGNRWLNLYHHASRPLDHPYSLYWQNETNPVQHAMTPGEVFTVIASILSPDLGQTGKKDEESFWSIFHSAWGDDRRNGKRNGKRRPNYAAEAWMYVQGKLDTYLRKTK